MAKLMAKLKSLPQLMCLVSLGILANPAMTWGQVTSLFLVYLLYMGDRYLMYKASGKERSEDLRFKSLEEEVKALIQAQNFKSLR